MKLVRFEFEILPDSEDHDAAITAFMEGKIIQSVTLTARDGAQITMTMEQPETTVRHKGGPAVPVKVN